MDLQLVIALNLMSLCMLAAVVVLIHRPPGYLSWAIANVVVVAIGGAGLYLAPERAGWIAAVAFVPLVLAPVLLSRLTLKRLYSNRTADAAFFARLAATFHPTDQGRFHAALLTAQAHDRIEDQVAALTELSRQATPAQREVIEAVRLRVQDDWPGVLALIQRTPSPGMVLRQLEVRALGEAGRIGDMLASFDAVAPHLQGPDLAAQQLYALAYSGRGSGVEKLLTGELVHLSEERKAFWRTIAAKRAGAPAAEWKAPLTRLAANARDANLARAAERHLAEPAGPWGISAPAAAPAVLDGIESRVGEEPARRAAERSLLRMPVTLVLITLICAMFVVEELSGGSENLRTLVNLGALWPPYVFERGEWWRLLTAIFLHFGMLHIAFNGLLLFILGRDCETRTGSLRMATVFLLGGLFSCGAVLWLMAKGYTQQAVLVGASGAVFAVFGSEVARQIVSWFRTHDEGDRRGLITAGVALLLQFAVDLTVPAVSLSAHLSGLIAGLAIGLAWSLAAPDRRAA